MFIEAKYRSGQIACLSPWKISDLIVLFIQGYSVQYVNCNSVLAVCHVGTRNINNNAVLIFRVLIQAKTC